MSKAFTKDDDDAGFEVLPASSLIGIPAGPFRLTFTGARIAATHTDQRVRDAVARAETLPRVIDPERAALGVSVEVKSEEAGKRTYRLVSAEERALIGDGCSVEGPIGSVLLGARIGDVCEVTLPRGSDELEVIALEGEPDDAGRSTP